MDFNKMSQDLMSNQSETQEEAKPVEATDEVKQEASTETTSDAVETKSEQNETETQTEAKESKTKDEIQDQETQDESSLQTTETQDSSTQKEDARELTEDEILQYLRGQRGLEVDSLDEVSKKQTFDEDSVFANDYVKTLNKFLRDTGRSEDEFRFIQAMENVDSFSDEDLVLAKMAQDSEGLTDAQVKRLFNSDYPMKQITEDMDDDEVREAKEHNELIEAKLKRDSIKAKKEFVDLANQYKVPQAKEQTEAPKEEEFNPEDFKKSYRESKNGLEEFEFDLGKDKKFTYKFDQDRLNSLNDTTPDEFLNSFVTEDGFDIDEFRNKMVLLESFNDILAQAYNQSASTAKEQVINEDLRNTQMDLQNKSTSTKNEPIKNEGASYEDGMRSIFGRK